DNRQRAQVAVGIRRGAGHETSGGDIPSVAATVTIPGSGVFAVSDLFLLAQNDAGGLWVGGFFNLWAILGILALVLWIWALVSAIQNPALHSTMRIVWDRDPKVHASLTTRKADLSLAREKARRGSREPYRCVARAF